MEIKLSRYGLLTRPTMRKMGAGIKPRQARMTAGYDDGPIFYADGNGDY